MPREGDTVYFQCVERVPSTRFGHWQLGPIQEGVVRGCFDVRWPNETTGIETCLRVECEGQLLDVMAFRLCERFEVEAVTIPV